jgi:hypothetical protein
MRINLKLNNLLNSILGRPLPSSHTKHKLTIATGLPVLGLDAFASTLIIPELVEPHWYEYLLHNLHAAMLRTLLFLERDSKTVVITIPWYLSDVDRKAYRK